MDPAKKYPFSVNPIKHVIKQKSLATEAQQVFGEENIMLSESYAIHHRLSAPGLCLQLTDTAIMATSWYDHGSPALLYRSDVNYKRCITDQRQLYVRVAKTYIAELPSRVRASTQKQVSMVLLLGKFNKWTDKYRLGQESTHFDNVLKNFLRGRGGTNETVNHFFDKSTQSLDDDRRGRILTALLGLSLDSMMEMHSEEGGGYFILPNLDSVFVVDNTFTGHSTIVIVDQLGSSIRPMPKCGDLTRFVRYVVQQFLHSLNWRWTIPDIIQKVFKRSSTVNLIDQTPSCKYQILKKNMKGSLLVQNLNATGTENIIPLEKWRFKVDLSTDPNSPLLDLMVMSNSPTVDSFFNITTTTINKIEGKQICRENLCGFSHMGSNSRQYCRECYLSVLSSGLRILNRIWNITRNDIDPFMTATTNVPYMESDISVPYPGKLFDGIDLSDEKQTVSPFIFSRTDNTSSRYEIMTPASVPSTSDTNNNHLVLLMAIKKFHLSGAYIQEPIRASVRDLSPICNKTLEEGATYLPLASDNRLYVPRNLLFSDHFSLLMYQDPRTTTQNNAYTRDVITFKNMRLKPRVGDKILDKNTTITRMAPLLAIMMARFMGGSVRFGDEYSVTTNIDDYIDVTSEMKIIKEVAGYLCQLPKFTDMGVLRVFIANTLKMGEEKLYGIFSV